MLLAGISLLSYRRRTALLWKVEGSSLFLCFFLQTIIKTVDSNVQLYFHIFIYCHFFIGEINLEISKRFKRLLYAILHISTVPFFNGRGTNGHYFSIRIRIGSCCGTAEEFIVAYGRVAGPGLQWCDHTVTEKGCLLLLVKGHSLPPLFPSR